MAAPGTVRKTLSPSAVSYANKNHNEGLHTFAKLYAA